MYNIVPKTETNNNSCLYTSRLDFLCLGISVGNPEVIVGVMFDLILTVFCMFHKSHWN